jgi:hypothetical protein
MTSDDVPIPEKLIADPAVPDGEELTAAIAPAMGSNKQTAIKARNMLLQKDAGFRIATPKQKRILLVEFAKKGRVIYGQAYDVIKVASPCDLDDETSVGANLESLSLYEVKSTNRSLPANFQGFFFSLSTAELLTAQSLGSRYRFAFVNVVTGDYLELALADLFGRARSIYPSWSIRF